jgi:hypothetical protein
MVWSNQQAMSTVYAVQEDNATGEITLIDIDMPVRSPAGPLILFCCGHYFTLTHSLIRANTVVI